MMPCILEMYFCYGEEKQLKLLSKMIHQYKESLTKEGYDSTLTVGKLRPNAPLMFHWDIHKIENIREFHKIQDLFPSVEFHRLVENDENGSTHTYSIFKSGVQVRVSKQLIEEVF